MLVWSTEVLSGALCLRLPVRWALICLFVAVSCAFCVPGDAGQLTGRGRKQQRSVALEPLV